MPGEAIGKKLTKAQRKRLKQRRSKQRRKAEAAAEPEKPADALKPSPAAAAAAAGIEVVHVEPEAVVPEAVQENDQFADLAAVFERFHEHAARATEPVFDDEEEDRAKNGGENDPAAGTGGEESRSHSSKHPAGATTEEEADEEEQEEQQQQLSRRARKRLRRPTLAGLKRRVAHPEVVEQHDTTAADPLTLVQLKAYRNSVPVPRHWSYKRRYLDGKRGFEKEPFKLPQFIEDTGISKLRGYDLEQEAKKSVKQRMREHVRPKLGRIEIAYEVLQDAFFRHQRHYLPSLGGHGDLYYEGKEFEKDRSDSRPGHLSARLQEALGLSGPLDPPPWLRNMQRYGPPPGYPNLQVPGLSAPLPMGAQFGNHPGGWGHPPVDPATGAPLYGDPFGHPVAQEEDSTANFKLWGRMESDDEEEDEGMGEADVLAPETTGVFATAGAGTPGEGDDEGAQTPLSTGTGYESSFLGGISTPGSTLQLRKDGGAEGGSIGGAGGGGGSAAAAQPAKPRALYQVLEERETTGDGIMGGPTKVYVMPKDGSGGMLPAPAPTASGSGGAGVGLSLDPRELANLDQEELERRYKEAQAANTDVVARAEMEEVLRAGTARQAARQRAAGQKRQRLEQK